MSALMFATWQNFPQIKAAQFQKKSRDEHTIGWLKTRAEVQVPKLISMMLQETFPWLLKMLFIAMATSIFGHIGLDTTLVVVFKKVIQMTCYYILATIKPINHWLESIYFHTVKTLIRRRFGSFPLIMPSQILSGENGYRQWMT
jgi:hypothetical protein